MASTTSANVSSETSSLSPGKSRSAAALRSVALLLRHAAGEQGLGDELEQAVDATLLSNPTRDLGGSATTVEFTDSVLDRLAAKTPDAR